MDDLILKQGGTAEVVEKRSRFIATIIPVTSEAEATENIEKLRKKYYDARHNCYAYIVFSDDKKDIIERSSDDGEPSGTAGRPMLDVLSGSGIKNILAVVTRYFGGTLLGSGGLVRAYSQAVQDGLKNCEVTPIRNGKRIKINLDYTSLGSVQYQMKECEVSEISGAYEEEVELDLVIPSENTDRFYKEMNRIFSGKERIEDLGDIRYGMSAEGVFIL